MSLSTVECVLVLIVGNEAVVLYSKVYCTIYDCAVVQDADYLGVFLKWRCVDGAVVSVKVKYSLAIIHRHDYTSNHHFTTTQRFTSSQALLGKTRLAVEY